MRTWQTLDRADTPDGALELRQRGDDDFLITIAGRVLMNSRASRSEEALARLTCPRVADRADATVVIGGLGMGCTLRAALDALPGDARVLVGELNPIVAEWCRGPLAAVNGSALDDPRVEVVVGDVSELIADLAAARRTPAADAILLDLFEGPHAGSDGRTDPFYGSRALGRTFAALAPGGCFAIWSEDRDAGFEKRLRAAGFHDVVAKRPGRGGRRHAVVIATVPGP